MTKPEHDKKQRRSTDDERRIREAWVQVKDSVERFRPHALTIECYTVYGEKDVEGLKQAARELLDFIGTFPHPQLIFGEEANILRFAKACDKLKKKLMEGSEVVGRAGRGKAAKTLAVYGAGLAIAWERSIPVFINMPIDLKTSFAKKASASKAEVAAALRAIVPNLEEEVSQKIAPSNQEHVYDATGHAILGIHHYDEMFRMAGIQGAHL